MKNYEINNVEIV